MKQWKGSIFKIIFPDIIVYLIMYLALDFVYIFWLKQPNMAKYREIYEIVCVWCARYRHMIPVTFLTGFYVAEVVRRYWDQFMSLPFPDKLALKIVTYVGGKVCIKSKVQWRAERNGRSPMYGATHNRNKSYLIGFKRARSWQV